MNTETRQYTMVYGIVLLGLWVTVIYVVCLRMHFWPHDGAPRRKASVTGNEIFSAMLAWMIGITIGVGTILILLVASAQLIAAAFLTIRGMHTPRRAVHLHV